MKKGSKVFIEGKIQTRDWEDSEGRKRYTTEVVAREMTMLDSKFSADSNTDSDSSDTTPKETASKDSDFEEDIPF